VTRERGSGQLFGDAPDPLVVGLELLDELDGSVPLGEEAAVVTVKLEVLRQVDFRQRIAPCAHEGRVSEMGGKPLDASASPRAKSPVRSFQEEHPGIGRPPISTIGLGRTSVSSARRVP
jgi:hypothetical protein